MATKKTKASAPAGTPHLPKSFTIARSVGNRVQSAEAQYCDSLYGRDAKALDTRDWHGVPVSLEGAVVERRGGQAVVFVHFGGHWFEVLRTPQDEKDVAALLRG